MCIGKMACISFNTNLEELFKRGTWANSRAPKILNYVNMDRPLSLPQISIDGYFQTNKWLPKTFDGTLYDISQYCNVLVFAANETEYKNLMIDIRLNINKTYSDLCPQDTILINSTYKMKANTKEMVKVAIIFEKTQFYV